MWNCGLAGRYKIPYFTILKIEKNNHGSKMQYVFRRPKPAAPTNFMNIYPQLLSDPV